MIETESPAAESASVFSILAALPSLEITQQEIRELYEQAQNNENYERPTESRMAAAIANESEFADLVLTLEQKAQFFTIIRTATEKLDALLTATNAQNKMWEVVDKSLNKGHHE